MHVSRSGMRAEPLDNTTLLWRHSPCSVPGSQTMSPFGTVRKTSHYYPVTMTCISDPVSYILAALSWRRAFLLASPPRDQVARRSRSCARARNMRVRAAWLVIPSERAASGKGTSSNTQS